jgi:hypothetical protein
MDDVDMQDGAQSDDDADEYEPPRAWPWLSCSVSPPLSSSASEGGVMTCFALRPDLRGSDSETGSQGYDSEGESCNSSGQTLRRRGSTRRANGRVFVSTLTWSADDLLVFPWPEEGALQS